VVIDQSQQPAAACASVPPAIVLGSGITALGVIRTLAKARIPAYVVEHDPLLRRSRLYRHLPQAPVADALYDLDRWLPGVPYERAVLMPCSDTWAASVAALPSTLRRRFPSSISTSAVLAAYVDKARFARTLSSLRVPHPWTRPVRAPADIASVPTEIFARAFLKPRDSQRFFRRFGVKAFEVRSPSEAVLRLEQSLAYELPMVLQEYIPGGPDRHVFLDGFVDRTGAVRALLARRRERMFPAKFGNSSSMVSIPVDDVAPAVASLRCLLEATRFRGMFSAEFKFDERDRTYKLLEVNARAWWYVAFAARCGVDVCRLAYLDALQQPVPDIHDYRCGRALVYPYHDFHACLELWRRNQLGALEWCRSWLRADQPVFSWADPFPAVHAAAGVLADALRNRIWRARSESGAKLAPPPALGSVERRLA
jgi:D-aspartate ligase